jgi:hypothetical protein
VDLIDSMPLATLPAPRGEEMFADCDRATRPN